jgi:hypothetical protein
MAIGKPRMSRQQRVDRDQLIYRMHLAGVSYRDIARRHGLTGAAVHKIVRRELDSAVQLRDDLVDDADTEHLERMRQLYAAHSAKALAGDTRAAELCRRLLADIARVQGLNTSVAERVAPSRMSDDDFEDGDDDGEDELTAYRRRREEAEDGGAEGMAAYGRECDEQRRELERQARL